MGSNLSHGRLLHNHFSSKTSTGIIGPPTSDISATIADSNVALLKPCLGSLTKDKISSSSNQATVIVLLALIRQNGVLESVKLAAIIGGGRLST
jgi:hypothetical protein